MKTSSTNKRNKKTKQNNTKKQMKSIKKRVSCKLTSVKKQIKVKVNQTITLKKPSKKTKRDFLIEILKEYNLSKNIERFEKSVKQLMRDKEFQKGESFKTIFSKILTKAYIKSKLTYDFTPKDLKFIKDIINKVSPSKDTIRKKEDVKTLHQTNNLKLVSSLFLFPHTKKGTEDAYVISDKMVVVCDGVGGWSDSGVDPSMYPNQLCNNLLKKHKKIKEFERSSPKELLKQASKNIQEIGSSTCCILLFDLPNKKLFTSYIGDSGYLILRFVRNKLTTLFKSEDQTHSFNFPYQIGTCGDDPDSAFTFVHKIKEKDIIITGSDGLWDNLHITQIIDIIHKYVDDSLIINTDSVSKEIAEQAKKFSRSRTFLTPYMEKGQENYIPIFGGKPDDITVIVTQLISS